MALNLQLLQITAPAISYLCLGGFIVFFSMISLIREKLYIGESILATVFGIIIGPYCANIFDPRSWTTNSNPITLEVMRITLAVGLFAIGVKLPQSYMADKWESLVVMIIPTMAIGWVTSAGFMFGIFPGLTYVSALCISACLTPTDPILAVAITSGQFAKDNIKPRIQHLIEAESAANDGLAYPFLSISIYLTLETSKRAAFGKWFLVGWLYQVILGTILGACIGLCFSWIMKYSLKRGFINQESYITQFIALPLVTVGLTKLLGSDDLLAAFAAGTAVSWDGDFKTKTENTIFASIIDLILNCAAFIYIGAWLPFEFYNSPELNITPWRLAVLFLCLIAFRRLPSLIILYPWIPDIEGLREALICGHFGPMGVSAIFISTLAVSELPRPQSPPQSQQELLAASLQPIVSFVVLGSILIHGLSIPSFAVWKRTLTLTGTWSQQPPGTPEWLNLTRRIGKPSPSRSSSEPDEVNTMEQGARTELHEVVPPSQTRTLDRITTPVVKGTLESSPGSGGSLSLSRTRSATDTVRNSDGHRQVRIVEVLVEQENTAEGAMCLDTPAPNREHGRIEFPAADGGLVPRVRE